MYVKIAVYTWLVITFSLSLVSPDALPAISTNDLSLWKIRHFLQAFPLPGKDQCSGYIMCLSYPGEFDHLAVVEWMWPLHFTSVPQPPPLLLHPPPWLRGVIRGVSKHTKGSWEKYPGGRRLPRCSSHPCKYCARRSISFLHSFLPLLHLIFPFLSLTWCNTL